MLPTLHRRRRSTYQSRHGDRRTTSSARNRPAPPSINDLEPVATFPRQVEHCALGNCSSCPDQLPKNGWTNVRKGYKEDNILARKRQAEEIETEDGKLLIGRVRKRSKVFILWLKAYIVSLLIEKQPVYLEEVHDDFLENEHNRIVWLVTSAVPFQWNEEKIAMYICTQPGIKRCMPISYYPQPDVQGNKAIRLP
jgi:hypothetical protein